MSAQHRDFSFDFIRSIAILLVIFIHVSGVGFLKYSSANWNAVNAFDSFSRISVPLFFMLSGALLLDKQENLYQLGKRIFKVVIALVSWSIIFTAWERRHGSNMSYFHMIETPVAFHLWYCYTIIGAYLFLPIMREFAQHASSQSRFFIIFLWILSVGLPDFLGKFFQLTIGLDLRYFQSFFGFLLFGNLLGKIRNPKTSFLLFSGLAWLILSLCILGSTQLLSKKAGQGDGFFYSYFSPLVIIGSACAFLFLRECGTRLSNSKVITPLSRSLSQASFGIYLFHPFALDQLSRKFKINYETGTSWIWIPVTSIACLAISWAVVFVIQKVPYLRRICP